MIRLCLFLSLLFITLPRTGVRAQTTYFVTTDGADDPARDGLSAATAWASLSYACERVPGSLTAPDTIQIGAGLFLVGQAATPEPGVTIQGMGPAQTILRTDDDWTMVNRPRDETWEDYIISFSKFPLGYQGVRTTNFTIRNLRLESTLGNLTHGGIYLRDADDVLIENLEIEDFAWAGIYLRSCDRVEVRYCTVKNANRTRDGFFSGNIYTAWIRGSSFHHNKFRNTVPGEQQFGVGYKGGGHNDVQIYDNDFTTGSGFDIEIPFEQEYGVDIYNNHFNRPVSVPKTGTNGDPANEGFTYSFRIRDNYFTNGYDIEGPREYMEVCYNFFDVQNDNGRCYAQFGNTDVIGRNKIHHNVAVGVDRSFFWVNNGLDTVEFYNNTLYYEFADDRAAAMIDVRSTVDGWKIKNNLLVSPDVQPRRVGNVLNNPGTEFEANLVINALDAALPAGNFRDQDPGLSGSGVQPAPFFVPASAASFVVDKGVDVGFPFDGAAPDIGAYEFSEVSLPIELLSFGGTTTEQTAELRWSVANAEAFSHFEVEEVDRVGPLPDTVVGRIFPEPRSLTNGADFNLTVPWKSVLPTRSFRLRLVDTDGSVRLSEVITLQRANDVELAVYPNPAVNRLSFASPELGAYRVYAADGRLVLRGALAVPQTTVGVAKLRPGTYRLVVIGRRGEIRAVSFVR